MSGSERREEIRAHLESTRAHLEATNERITEKAGRNLVIAILSGLLLGGVFLVSVFVAKPIFGAVVAIVVVLGVVELASAFRVAGRRVPRIGAGLGGVTVVAGAYFWDADGMLLGLLVGSALLIVWRSAEGIFRSGEVPLRTLVSDVFSGLFVLVYVAFLASFAILLIDSDDGQWWVFTLVAVVVAVDVGAYAAGVTMGKHKMTPRISPNKTWEGFAGAAAAAIVVGILLVLLTPLGQPWWVGALLGAVVLLTATGGDLTESLIKRNLGVKDMSSWIPGHGGLLDRLDSILPSTVGVYGIALALGAI